MQRARPPTTDEFHNLILLRQALTVLASEAPEQRALYPEDRVAVREMRALFLEALELVRGVFWPAFPPELREQLEAIETFFADPSLVARDALASREEWAAVRLAAVEDLDVVRVQDVELPRVALG